MNVNNILLCSGLCIVKVRVIAVSLYDPSLSISEIWTRYSPDGSCIVLRHCVTEPASLNRGAASVAIWVAVLASMMSMLHPWHLLPSTNSHITQCESLYFTIVALLTSNVSVSMKKALDNWRKNKYRTSWNFRASFIFAYFRCWCRTA